ncbi:cytochrome c oxidase subunit 5A, mitochondrial [Prorops nasuta]|uniref:cytochrome c oxidase subunit 5A, mitochondrial n=1 Tax=Prorops nasuta TaxID=863751 RepID=UPI0034CD7EF5
MFRAVAGRLGGTVKNAVFSRAAMIASKNTRLMSHGPKESDDEFDTRFENYFNRNDIDGWELRKGLNDLAGMDLVPEPRILVAALKAARRLNDIAVAIRLLELVKFKTGYEMSTYNWVIKEIRPTLDELGISTPEELGYDKPELAMDNVFDIH